MNKNLKANILPNARAGRKIFFRHILLLSYPGPVTQEALDFYKYIKEKLNYYVNLLLKEVRKKYLNTQGKSKIWYCRIESRELPSIASNPGGKEKE